MRRQNFDVEPRVNVIVNNTEYFWTYRQQRYCWSHCVLLNLHVQQMMTDKLYKPTSRLTEWEEITAPKVRLYLAVLIILMNRSTVYAGAVPWFEDYHAFKNY